MNKLPVASRTVFYAILIIMAVALLYAFFNSRIGQTAVLICCGGAVLLGIVGFLSEHGMKRPR